MGTMRNLPDPHPIYKLLRPHFQYTMAINTRARETLIAPNTIIDQIFSIGGEGKDELMSMDYATYNIQRTNIKRNIKERGVDDPDLLPHYYYRDDGLKIWDAIESYARDIVTHFYRSDDDVKNDKELKSWAEDLYFNGFPTSYIITVKILMMTILMIAMKTAEQVGMAFLSVLNPEKS